MSGPAPRRGRTISGRFNSAMITVAMLPATRIAMNTTIQIQGRSWSQRLTFRAP